MGCSYKCTYDSSVPFQFTRSFEIIIVIQDKYNNIIRSIKKTITKIEKLEYLTNKTRKDLSETRVVPTSLSA